MHNNSDNGLVNSGRRRFVKTTTGGLVLAATGTSVLQGCSSMAGTPDSAIAAWHSSMPDSDLTRWALSHAILAPNPHNLQPWLVDISTPNEMLVAIDPDRLLPETDPFGRQIMIGTGAMLGIFELALSTKGFTTKTEWLATASETNESSIAVGEPLLRVTISKGANGDDSANNQQLFEQIRRRHTVRAEYDPTRMPNASFESAVMDFQTQNQHVGFINSLESSDDFNKIADWVKTAWEIELATPSTAMESMRLLRIGKREIEEHRDGIVIDSAFVVMLNKLGLIDRSQPLEPGTRTFNQQINDFNSAVDSTPVWLFITSDENTRMDQINAGKTYVMAQLQATESGLVMHPLSQGLQEYEQMSSIYGHITEKLEQITNSSATTVQMLARVGYLPAGAKPPTPSPRRGLDAHIRNDLM